MRIILLGLFLLGMLNATAQSSAEDKTGVWYIVGSNNKISDKINFKLQADVRLYEVISEVQQIVIRPGVQYKFSEKLSGTIGYAFFGNDPSYLSDQPEDFSEHRIFEELNIKNSFGKLNLTHRYRFVQRFLRFEEGTVTSHWARYMAKITYPFSTSWGVDVYDEVFLTYEDPIFVQNWLGGGITYTISKQLKFRAGYLKIMQAGQNFDRIQLGLSIATDLRKKEKED